MHTLGYSFSPWRDPQAIADGPSILRYVRETADAVRRHRADPLRPPRRSPRDGRRRRSLLDRRGAACRRRRVEQLQLLVPARPAAATTTTTAAMRRVPRRRAVRRADRPPAARGPRTSTTTDKRVVVIGSGATAITLVPALAAARRTCDDAAALAHLCGLAARPRWARRPRAAVAARDGRLHTVVRAKNVGLQTLSFQLSRRRPQLMKALIRRGAAVGAAPRVRRRHPFQPELRPVGPAAVRLSRRRPVRGAVGRPRLDRDRHGRASFTEDGIELGVGRDARRRPDRHRDRPAAAGAGRHAAASSTSREVSAPPTRRVHGLDARPACPTSRS